jgi:hypothetical protein
MNLEDLTQDERALADSMEAAGVPTTEAGMKAKFETLATDESLVFQNPGEQSAWWRWLKAVAVAPALWLMEYIIKNVIPNQFVKTATGKFLDTLAWPYGLTRKIETKALGNIKFSRDNTGSFLPVPLGTWIKTTSINGNVYRVKTTQAVEFGVNDLDILIPIEAENIGAAYNLASGYYILLEEPIIGVSGVTNESDWLTTPGSEEEKDDEFRERIRGYFSNVSDHFVGSVYQNLIASNMSIDYDNIFIDYTSAPRGPGSANAYVVFDLNVPAQSYLDSVNSYLGDQGHHGLGDDVVVYAMPETPYNLGAVIWLPSGMSSGDATEIYNDVEQMIRCAFRENKDFDVVQTWPWSRFSVNRLAGAIMRKHSGIESIEFDRGDITSEQDMPKLGTLTLTIEAVM